MPQKRKTNLWVDAPPGYYIYNYKGQSDRYGAWKQYEDAHYGETPNNSQKFFRKSALFYSIDEAKEWLLSLPEKMDREFRYDRYAPTSD
jgi:hypothetical protein